MWSLKLTVLFLATSSDAQGHATITESLTREFFDGVSYFDEQSCTLKAQWWMSPAASATGAVKKAECVQTRLKESSASVRGAGFPTRSKRGAAYPREK
jgi:hypothetical protein